MKPKKIKTQTVNRGPKIPGVEVPNLDFTFRSHYRWLEHYEDGKKYSNHLKSADVFSEKIKDLVQVMIPGIYEHYSDIFEKRNAQNVGFKHTHLIGEEKKDLVKTVAEAVTNKDFGDVDWWQIGKAQGVRIFGFYQASNKTFYPVFVDWNHMIYPSEKHNTTDIRSLKYPD